MKQRFKYLFCIILVLLFSTLTGCSEKTNIDTPDEPKPSAILDSKEKFGDNENLFYIPNENIDVGFLQNVSSFCGDFLVYGFNDVMSEESTESSKFQLKLISSSTGEELAFNAFSNIEAPSIQIYGNQLVITDWANGSILFLDEHFQEVSRYQVPCNYNALYVSSDLEKAYVFLPDDGLQVITLSSGETTTLLEQATNLYISVGTHSIITFSYTDKNTLFDVFGALDLETGEILDFPFTGSFYNVHCVNDTWLATHSEDMNTHYIGNDNLLKLLHFETDYSSIFMQPDTGNLLVTIFDRYGFSQLKLYDANGKFLSECQNGLEGAAIQGDLVWSEVDNGYYFMMLDPSGKDMLMFWDMSVEVSGEDLAFEELSVETLSENAVSIELYNRAKEISAAYGVEIRIAEQLDNDYIDYKVTECLNEDQITQALNAVENAFSAYPEGYFDQLLYGSIREIELHLVGPVTNLAIPDGDINGFTSFSGFVQTRSEKAVVCVNIEEGFLEEHLHHEIFHLTDNKMTFDAEIREDSPYSEEEWMKLNPEGFEYAGSLFELPEETLREEYDVWFVGNYSKTFPREDRATIMEYAMIGMDAMFVSAPHRQAKLEYLSECIRNSFDTTNWPEVTIWEDTLNKSR